MTKIESNFSLLLREITSELRLWCHVNFHMPYKTLQDLARQAMLTCALDFNGDFFVVWQNKAVII